MAELLDLALEAHGGRTRWERVRDLRARVRSGGLALAMKGQGRHFADFTATVAADEPRTVVDSYPEPGMRGVFSGDGVRIESEDGEPLEERADPRAAFRRPRRRLWWDHLDMLYFVGYALGNYLTTPYLFTRPGVRSEEVEPARDRGELLRRLRVAFPEAVPTHSPEQTFWFSQEGELRRLDYTAQVIGAWAKAVHRCGGYREFDGIRLPTRRRVTPRVYGTLRALPGPTLVRIELVDLTPA